VAGQKGRAKGGCRIGNGILDAGAAYDALPDQTTDFASPTAQA